MCLCWAKDENGKVVGIVGMEELRRRINDPTFMPELKAARARNADRDAERHRKHVESWPEGWRQEAVDDWKRYLGRN